MIRRRGCNKNINIAASLLPLVWMISIKEEQPQSTLRRLSVGFRLLGGEVCQTLPISFKHNCKLAP